MEGARIFVAVVGGGLIVLAAVSILRAFVIPRARNSAVTRVVDGVDDAAFRLVTRRLDDYESRDQVLAAQPATVLVAYLVTWLASFLLGFALLLWPWTRSLGEAFRESASSMFTLGYAAPYDGAAAVLDAMAAAAGLIVVALQIAYLPSLYAAFNRRETDVALLVARAGTPPWGPELLARTRYGVTTRTDDLPEFYALWERWAADVAESHANYPVLIRFRSPQPLSSWLVGLLAVLDSAALYLALCPSQERYEVRACVRMGFTALRQVAASIGVPVDNDPDPDQPLQLSYDDYLAGVQRIIDVGFPIERTPEEAWPHFRGWRVNYESIAYAIAYRIDDVPALWSGPRRWPAQQIPPQRPRTRVARDAH